MIESNKNNKTYFLTSFPIIMMILKPYAISSGSDIFLCDILVVLLFLYFLIKKSFQLYMPLSILLCIEIILTLISNVSTTSAQINTVLALKIGIVFFLYLAVFSSIWNLMDPKNFYNIIEIIGLICAILAILQFVFSSFGFEFYDGKLPLPMGENSYFGGLFDANTQDLRVHSFFEESSYLAFFEIPIVVHFIQKNKYIKAIVCALACVFSGALTGVIGLVISVALVILWDERVEKKYKFYLIAIILCTLIAITFLYNTNSSIRTLIDYYIRRKTTLEISMKRTDSSFSQRIIGNSALFTQYKFINRLIGVGFNQYPLYFGLAKDYSNDVVSTLLNFGYIGIMAFIATLVSILKKATGHGRIMWVIFIMLLAVDHSWFGPMFFYILTWTIMKSSSSEAKAKIFLNVRY